MEMGQFYSFPFVVQNMYFFKELSELASYIASICQFDFKPPKSLFVIDFLRTVIYIHVYYFFL